MREETAQEKAFYRAATARNRKTAKNTARWGRFYGKLMDKKINTYEEIRMKQMIKRNRDQTTTWIVSRVDHLYAGFSYGGQNKSPAISQMIKLSNNVDYWIDLTQLPSGNPNDPEGMDVGEYQIKQIQSRLRFYANGLMPIHVIAQIVKINNSGRYGVGEAAGTNADLVPTTHMLPDTNLRYGGIHKSEKKFMTPPGTQGAVIVDRKRFIIYPKPITQIYNTTTSLTQARQVYAERQITLNKKYKRPARLIQVLNQETADDVLSAPRNKAKFIGDRFFLQIMGNYQQGFDPDTQNNTASTSNLYFYGTSGCIYNFDKKPIQISVPLPADQTIQNSSFDE